MTQSYDYDAIKDHCLHLQEENAALRADLADRIEHARFLLWAEVLLFFIGVAVGVAMGRGYIV